VHRHVVEVRASSTTIVSIATTSDTTDNLVACPELTAPRTVPPVQVHRGEQREAPGAGAAETRRRLRRKLERELGPEILGALEDPAVVEIMVNEDGGVWCDRLGSGMERLPAVLSPHQAARLVGTVATLLCTVANAEHPIVEGELLLHDARFEGIVPPVAPRPIASIRKRARRVHTLGDYRAEKRITAVQAGVLRGAIRRGASILVSGGAGSGKTTFANALLHEKVKLGDPNQRIVILEDTVELQCSAPVSRSTKCRG
jgi:Flp pilus assembly CpaF family ATPase